MVFSLSPLNWQRIPSIVLYCLEPGKSHFAKKMYTAARVDKIADQSKDKIAFVTPFLPYPDVPHAGGIFTWNLLKCLHRDYHVTLFTRIQQKETHILEKLKETVDIIEYMEYSDYPGQKFGSIILRILSYLSFYYQIRKKIKLHKFRLIQAEYPETLIFLGRSDTIFVHNLHDVASLRYQREYRNQSSVVPRIFGSIKFIVYRLIEKLSTEKASLNLVCTEFEKMHYDQFYPQSRTEIIPLLNPDPLSADSPVFHPGKLIFAGAMDRKYNQEAAEYILLNIFPVISREFPDMQLILAGNNPGVSLKRAASGSDRIFLTGHQEDFNLVFEEGGIFLSPVFNGGGMLYKNLLAMWYGLPVVTTSFGNLGFSAVPGKDILIAENKNEFIQAVNRLQDPACYQEIASNGQRLVRSRFNADKVLGSYRKMIRGLIHEYPG